MGHESFGLLLVPNHMPAQAWLLTAQMVPDYTHQVLQQVVSLLALLPGTKQLPYSHMEKAHSSLSRDL